MREACDKLLNVVHAIANPIRIQTRRSQCVVIRQVVLVLDHNKLAVVREEVGYAEEARGEVLRKLHHELFGCGEEDGEGGEALEECTVFDEEGSYPARLAWAPNTRLRDILN